MPASNYYRRSPSAGFARSTVALPHLSFIALAILFVWQSKCAFAAPEAAAKPDRPNLVLILADDLGYGDLGCYGGRLVATPNLDRLARQGTRFTDGYVTASVCAPSRCGLMSGAYGARFGMYWNTDRARYRFPESHKLLPETLRAGGYVTGMFGKWNIPRDPKTVFDVADDIMDWEGDYFPGEDGQYIGVNHGIASGKKPGWREPRPGEEYLTDRLGRHAVEFIDQNAARPFFLYLAFNAVHSPWQADKKEEARFAHLDSEPLRLYAAMLASLDANVGRVLDKLAQAGLEDNTLVAFVSDNGPAMGSPNIVGWPPAWPQKLLMGSAGPLRGYKAQFHEGGIRVPFFLRWPKKLAAGKLCAAPVISMDLYPTFCAAAGVPVPQGTVIDGVDLLPFLNGPSQNRPRDRLFWTNGTAGVLREGDWKLITAQGPVASQLFNLKDDLGETQNLAAQHPERLRAMHEAWKAWSAPMPPPANPQPKAKPKPARAKAPRS